METLGIIGGSILAVLVVAVCFVAALLASAVDR
jgi:hypothetical protein